MSNRLTPTDRIIECERQHAEELLRQYDAREKVLKAAGELALKYSEGGIALVQEQPTEMHRRSTGNNFHYYIFDHDKKPAYGLTTRTEWVIGGVSEVNWTFDSLMDLPIRDETYKGVANLSSKPNWFELDAAFKGMLATIDELGKSPLVTEQQIEEF